ncbi:hypothetical protein [Caulobacter sp. DWR1-3-2b1]
MSTASQARPISIGIDRPAAEVYAFVRFERDADMVAQDLAALKALLET